MDFRNCSQVCANWLRAVVACAALFQSSACSLAVASVQPSAQTPVLASSSGQNSANLSALSAASLAPATLVAKQLSSAGLAQVVPRDRSWPLSYTVELDKGGALRADGRDLSGVQELRTASLTAAGQGSFATAVFFAAPGVSSEQRTAVTQTLVSSGFAQVRIVGRAAPRRFWETSALNAAQSRQVSAQVAPTSEAAGQAESFEGNTKKVAQKSPSKVARTVVVKTVGLHVGGGARNEASRQRLVRHFERYFPGLATCHVHAADQRNNASFGIDVYVPAEGGRPKLGQIRSRLRGQKFRRCMQEKFRAIVFRPPESGRRTAISYSLLFKPVPTSSR